MMKTAGFWILPILFLCSCSLFQKENEPVVTQVEVKDRPVRFSENPNVGVFNAKKYKRTTRQSMEEESELGSRAGSLWSPEGQTAYLFTQNQSRREGDILSVKLDGTAKTQVETKVNVIKKLLARLDAPPPPPVPAPGEAPVPQEGTPLSDENAARKLASEKTPDGKPAVAAKAVAAKPEEEKVPEEPFNVESVSTKIVERMVDGSYRVKGSQTFMIGKREYKVIVTGMVRSEDFNDEGVSANKLVDPQFDVVSIRRSQVQ